MRQGSIAKRYATALLQVAQGQGKIDEFQGQLEAIARAFSENPALQTAMASPVVPPSKKKAIFSALAPKLGINPTVGNLIHVLIDNERIPELPLLVLLFRDLADEQKGRVRVQVTSASPLGAVEGQLKGILEKSLKQEVLLESKVDPEILGGLVVRVQDRVFNASLKGELERLKESLTAEAVA
ncbi:ATP synthase F1 subunit delta [bacterium]|nr:MAG: ATP synthase F1 subunit delta [bacterium]